MCTWSGTLKDTKFLRGKWLKTTLQWSEVSGSHLYLTDFKDKNFPWAKAQGTVFDDCNMGDCDNDLQIMQHPRVIPHTVFNASNSIKKCVKEKGGIISEYPAGIGVTAILEELLQK